MPNRAAQTRQYCPRSSDVALRCGAHPGGRARGEALVVPGSHLGLLSRIETQKLEVLRGKQTLTPLNHYADEIWLRLKKVRGRVAVKDGVPGPWWDARVLCGQLGSKAGTREPPVSEGHWGLTRSLADGAPRRIRGGRPIGHTTTEGPVKDG